MPTLEATSLIAVPEPATWAMLIGGLAGVGLVLRRSSHRARRRFYLNSGLTDAEATTALKIRRGDLAEHVAEMKRRRDKV